MSAYFYRSLFLLFLMLLASCGSSNNSVDDLEELYSEERADDATWETEQAEAETIWKRMGNGEIPANSADVSKVAVSMDAAVLDNIPVWSNDSAITEGFTKVRDTAFISWTYNNASFPRRSTWLYPDDGCFARAELMVLNLETWEYSSVAKIFVFGNLQVTSANAAKEADGTTKTVKWWYHVAPILKSADEGILVFDPAIQPSSPVSLASWLNSMGWNDGADTSFYFNICPAHTYIPQSVCDFAAPGTGDYDSTLETQKYYLSFEWNRLVSLGRDPQRELGDYPPWLQ